MVVKDKPQAYYFLSWHDLLAHKCSCQVAPLVEKLRAINNDVLPIKANSEAIIRLFADSCGIRLADPDVEPYLVFPHRLYASRAWVREEYVKFIGFCRATGWTKRPGRPKGVLPGRPAPEEPIWPTATEQAPTTELEWATEPRNQEGAASEDALLQPAPEPALELAGG